MAHEPQVSVLTNHLRYTLGLDPLPVTTNPSTTLKQAERAQQWLLEVYLHEWLTIVGTVAATSGLRPYDVARLERLSTLRQRLEPGDQFAVAGATKTELVFMLGSLQTHLRLFLSGFPGAPIDRSLQWGIWGRDVPMAIVDAFRETEGLDGVVCEGVAQCTMLCAFLVSQVVQDEAIAEQISAAMFDTKTHELLRVLDGVTPAPEA